jgi:hypothetical protein
MEDVEKPERAIPGPENCKNMKTYYHGEIDGKPVFSCDCYMTGQFGQQGQEIHCPKKCPQKETDR